ncbi:Ldh family oxidoreductase [Agrobacterium genomosp. 13]|uniref:Enzyme n=1 Tax=Agrobacterium genomosp. 13 str. CFBP 6927 TaxID=1183428 RepID=A0ABP2BL08_9HYPH|nr:Ldh family oxidoreductase [Agrobacterium genomosp. 13]CUX50595.1 putative enzyme [Agrobacterium genomosp. 13 str. CFBP 6927]
MVEKSDARDELIGFRELKTLLETIFVNAGTAGDTAGILAENCAGCERDGALSHGIFRMPGYVGSLRSGWVDGLAVPDVTDIGPSFIRVDARNGFAQRALSAAHPLIKAAVEKTGVAIVAIRNSHHFSALWPDIESFALSGHMAITAVNGLANVVPHGGRQAVYGTNPIAFAVPVENAAPLVVDQATSVMANGEVRLHALAGKPVPDGTGVDRDGNPTMDPHMILSGGALNTFGGYKGSSIALFVEILAGAITGGQFSFENDFAGFAGAETPKAGQFLMVIDPDWGGSTGFASRLQHLCGRLTVAGQDRLPGARRFANRTAAEKWGIPISPGALHRLRTLAGEKT